MGLVNLAYNGASTLVEERLPRISLYGMVPIIVFLAIALIVYLNYRRKRQK
jgi:hypothetical protein